MIRNDLIFFGTILICRIASRSAWVGAWEKAGEMYDLDGGDEWYCEKPEAEWEGDKEAILADFVDGSDRRQEMVVTAT